MDVVLVDSLADKMEVHINVLHPGMEMRVLGEFDSTLVVAVEGGWKRVVVKE